MNEIWIDWIRNEKKEKKRNVFEVIELGATDNELPIECLALQKWAFWLFGNRFDDLQNVY